MAGHAHNDAGAVAHEDIVGHEHREHAAGDRVDDLHPLQADAGLFLIQLPALKVRLAGGGSLVLLHLVPVGDFVLPLLQQRMLRRNDHIGRTEKGIGTGGVDGDIVAHIGLKGDLRTGRATDPVLLLDLHALDEIQIVQVINETVGILGNAEHPLALFLADHLAAAALAHALHHFLVGQDALAAGAPVHRHGGLVGQAVLEHLQEDPLGPLIILGVGGVYAAVPIEAVAQHFKLAGKVLDVFLGDHSGMDMVFDGEVLRGQAKGVKADGEQNIVALHALFTGNHVDGGKGPGMAHMESRCGGIRKLDKAVKLFTGLVAGNGAIGLGFFPIVLPFFLNGRKIVLHTVSPLSEYLFAHNKAKRPRPHKSVRGVRKRYTTLIRLRIAPPPSAAPSARSILCNGRARPALPPPGTQAGNSGASAARLPHRLAPAADSLWVELSLPFPHRCLLQDIAKLIDILESFWGFVKSLFLGENQ